MLSHVLGAVDKTSSSFSAHGKIGNFIIIIIVYARKAAIHCVWDRLASGDVRVGKGNGYNRVRATKCSAKQKCAILACIVNFGKNLLYIGCFLFVRTQKLSW